MRHTWQIVGLTAALLCGLTPCSTRSSAKDRSKHPDKALFEKAMVAVQEKRFDVANLTLQTLINTYPDSKYAGRAKLALQDPRIASCGEYSTSPECAGRVDTELPH